MADIGDDTNGLATRPLNFRYQLFALCSGALGRNDGSTFLRKAQCNCLPDTATGAGDDRDFVLKTAAHLRVSRSVYSRTTATEALGDEQCSNPSRSYSAQGRRPRIADALRFPLSRRRRWHKRLLKKLSNERVGRK
jgi:hypothetical protein